MALTLADLLAAKETELRSAESARETATTRQNTILDAVSAASRSALTPDEQTAFDAASTEKRAASATVTKLAGEVEALRGEIKSDSEYVARSEQTREAAPRPKYDEVTRVTSEPRTYSRAQSESGDRSFFSDVYRAEQRSDYSARERLVRHQKECEVEGELSKRALATGGAAGLVVPQYLIDLAAPILRAGRPFLNVCNHNQIPEQGMSFVIPRGTTGASAALQATENSAVSITDEVWANLTVPVVTIAGQAQVSRQLLDRGAPGTDAIIYMDLARAYHAQLDLQALTANNSPAGFYGVQNTAGIGAATAFGAAPTITNFNLKVAGQINSVAAAGAGVQARVIVMHPRRWSWLLGQVDSTGRPVVFANNVSNFNAAGIITNPGAISADTGGMNNPLQSAFVGIHSSGLPVLTDLNVPAAVGTNSEDLVFVVDNTELFLWEDGDGNPKELRFEQTLGNQLTTTLVVAGYAAFSAGRYPLAVGKVGGLDTVATQGLVAPSF